MNSDELIWRIMCIPVVLKGVENQRVDTTILNHAKFLNFWKMNKSVETVRNPVNNNIQAPLKFQELPSSDLLTMCY